MPRPHRSTIAIALLGLAGLTAACAGGDGAMPSSAAGPSSADDLSVPLATGASPSPRYRPVGSTDAWLIVGREGQDGLHVIRASTEERISDLPLGVPDETWATMVSATSTNGSTVVRELEVAAEPPGRSQTIDGEWRLPTVGLDPLPVGVSADGQTIVLVEAGVAATDAVSRFAVLSRTFDAGPRVVELHGEFEFDALSPDGSTLYVVEHLPAPPAGHYQVRAVDTATGVLQDGAVVDKQNLDEAMAGYPIAQLRRPDGFVFTLYRGAEHPFIHALSTVDGWAICIDLPDTGADDAAAALDWGLAEPAGGGSIYAVNGTLGLAVEIGASDLGVRRTGRFAGPESAAISLAKFGHEPGGPAGRRVVATADGSTVFAAGSGGIVRIGTSNLSNATTLLRGSAVDALALTPDGQILFALLHDGGRIVELDAGSGEEIGHVAGGRYERLVAVMPW